MYYNQSGPIFFLCSPKGHFFVTSIFFIFNIYNIVYIIQGHSPLIKLTNIIIREVATGKTVKISLKFF